MLLRVFVIAVVANFVICLFLYGGHVGHIGRPTGMKTAQEIVA
jgi:hypothetical protein